MTTRKPGVLGTNVRSRREDVGLSREQLAVRAGIGSKTVFRIEVAGDSPTLTVIELLAAALGCTAAELLTEPEAEAQAPEETGANGDTEPETKAS